MRGGGAAGGGGWGGGEGAGAHIPVLEVHGLAAGVSGLRESSMCVLFWDAQLTIRVVD